MTAGPAEGRSIPPSPARVERIDEVDGPLRERLLSIWTSVVNAGGWVGFVPPVDRRDVEPALDAALDRVARGLDWLVVVRRPAPSGPSPAERVADPSSGSSRALADPSPSPAGRVADLASGADDVAGFAFVAGNDRLLSEHWRWVLRVQIAPERRQERLGSVLMDGIARLARDAGIEMLLLTVRGGEGLEGFYERNGYREVARIPRAIRVAAGDDRDQVHLLHEL